MPTTLLWDMNALRVDTEDTISALYLRYGAAAYAHCRRTVSYTHLTLPTNREV